ncbi:VOC family protein [uncultured Erythrobacter sp.]|uniref:VOC family protein n=1 Tax=uncultured Erythrobacter sp. TaxID=263913 RepID=UPI002632326F|nr:VOC family protein [uncultured Erythrobacter sp.]
MSLFSNYTLHHVGIVLPSIEDAERHMESFGLAEDYRGYVAPWQCWCIFTKPETGAAIELVVADGGPLTKFNKGVGGVHHFAYAIDDFADAQTWCEKNDLQLLEPEPIKGAGNFLCNFIHPVATRGIQIELVQELG